MKVLKFPQSCILIETKGKKVLVDPSEVKYEERFLDTWKQADAILVTHRHSDHIYADILKNLNIPIYSTQEVLNFYPSLKINLIKENDIFQIGQVKIEVVKAIHGFIAAGGEIFENVGFIIDDGETRLYITSDTIRFNNNYKADVLFADVTAFDASMSKWGAVATMKDVGAKLLIVAHQEAGKLIYGKEELESYFDSQKINYIIPEIMQSIEI